MSDTRRTHEELLARIVRWAEAQPDVCALLTIGSRARQESPADEWSDLDLVMITTAPHRYVSTDWLKDIGDYWLTFLEKTATGDMIERRVMFEGGLDVDVIPIGVDTFLQMQDDGDSAVAGVLRRGYHIHVDKAGIAARLGRSEARPPSQPPTAAEFLEVINDFLYHAVWAVKKLRRGEGWVAKSCIDGYMKRRMVRMVEWHARATHGWEYETWHEGRFLERWADASLIAELRRTFGEYEQGDLLNALHATMNLFRRLGTETAAELGYSYPDAIDARVRQWIETAIASRSNSTSGVRIGSQRRDERTPTASRLHGLLLKESLADDGPLDLVHVIEVKLSRVRGAVPPQPSWWTEVHFEADAARAAEIAQSFSAALKPAVWYLHCWTDSHVFVAFPGRVFTYARGDRAAHDEAIAYGRSAGVPAHQLDWKEGP